MAGNIKGITVEIGGDTTKLGKALADVNSKTKSLQSELKGVNTLLKMNPGNVTLLTQKQDLLTKAVGNTKEKLDTLKIAQEQAQEQFEKGEITEEQYRDLQREIVLTEGKLENLTNELKEFGSVGAQQVAHVGEKMKEAGDKVTEFGKGFSVISAGTGAVLAGSVAAFTELDEGYDTIVTKTGATGEALEDLNQVADNIFGDMPVDMNNVGTAVGEINTRFGYTGDKLESLSRQFLQFSEINEVDLNNSIGMTDKILEQFNLTGEDAGAVLDLITKKAQETGIGADKLMSLIQDNGATFKDMGLGVNEAVVMLSNFEANGVNVETALRSLKKAAGEYAEEGKSMEKGLQDTVKSIKNAKTETEALAIAQEVFGTKGANEMAKAIREGRLSVDDLTAAMGTYAGTVESTFEGTLDPIDQGKVALNNLKLAGSELAAALQSTFAPALTTAVEKLKDLVNWFKDLSPEMKTTIVVLLSVVTALGPMIIGVGKLITAIGSILTIVPKVTAAFKALNLALTTSPWGLAALAVGALVTALIASSAESKKAGDETDKLLTKVDAFNKKIDEQTEAYNRVKQARSEAVSGNEAEFGYYQQLADELANITDENGKVKKGYEERAATITGVLSSALGTEISTDKLVADGKQKVIDKINELITAKKAEAMLSAYDESYTNAIKNQNQAYKDLSTAKKNEAAISKELKQANTELKEAQEKYDNAITSTSRSYYKAILDGEKKSVAELTEKQKESAKTVEKCENTYLDYQTTIANYEGVSGAIVSGDTAKINESLVLMTNNFVSAENGTKQSLQKQVTNAKQMLTDMQTALKNGEPGVTQQMVDNAKILVTKSEAELKKLKDKAKKSGEDAGDAKAKGIKSKEGDVKKAAKETSDSASKELDKTPSKAKSSGEKTGSEYASGVSSKKGDSKKAGEDNAKSTKSGMDSVKSKSSGDKMGADYASGVSSKSGAAKTAGTATANSAKGGMDGVKGDPSGKKLANDFTKGVNSGKGTAKTAGKNTATSAKGGMDSVKANSSGENFTTGFANGIESQGVLSKVISAAINVAKTALSWLKTTIDEGSPSRETKKSGKFFAEGFAIGIEDPGVMKKINSAAISVAKNALTSLRTTLDEHSPAKETEKSGTNFGKGFEIGIVNSADFVSEGAKKLAKSALTALNDGIETASKQTAREMDKLGEVVLASEKKYNDELERINKEREERSWAEKYAKANNEQTFLEEQNKELLASEKFYLQEKARLEKKSQTNTSSKSTNTSTPTVSATGTETYITNGWTLNGKPFSERTETTYVLSDIKGSPWEAEHLERLDQQAEYNKEWFEENYGITIEYTKKTGEEKLEIVQETGEKETQIIADANKEQFELSQDYIEANQKRQGETDEQYLERLKETAEKERGLYDAKQKDLETIQEVDRERKQQEEDKAQDEYLESLKKTAEKEREIYEQAIDRLEEYNQSALDKVEEFNDAREEIANSLKNEDSLTYDTLTFEWSEDKNGKEIQKSETFTKLADISRANSELEAYSDTLDQLTEKRGILPSEIAGYLANMSLEEGQKYASALLNASDEEYENYIQSLANKTQLTQDISQKLTTRQALDLRDELKDEFTEIINDEDGVMAQAMEIGDTIVENVEQGIEAKSESFTQFLSRFFTGIMGSVTSSVGLWDYDINNATLDGQIEKTFGSNIKSMSPDDILTEIKKCTEAIVNASQHTIVLDTGTLVGETIDIIDEGLASKQLLTARGV